MPRSLEADHWLAAIARPAVRVGLEAVYARASEAISARGPVCWASGRCCNFQKAGHRLYVTGLEAAYLVSSLGDPARLAFGPTPLAAEAGKSLTLQQFEVAPTNLSNWLAEPGPAPTCPFQTANLCTVHAIKPLACRLYFCDRTAQTWQSETLETLIAELRALHDKESIAYHYAEWRAVLAMFAIR